MRLKRQGRWAYVWVTKQARNLHMFEFTIAAKDDTGARNGIFQTPHGPLETPVFAPVGTAATVKATQPRDLKELGAFFSIEQYLSSLPAAGG